MANSQHVLLLHHLIFQENFHLALKIFTMVLIIQMTEATVTAAFVITIATIESIFAASFIAVTFA